MPEENAARTANSRCGQCDIPHCPASDANVPLPCTMEISIYIGYAAALIIGLTLGLIGGGGSILTVPILVYLMGIEPVLATAYSLFIVGLTALVGTFDFMRKKLVNFKVAVYFAVPSFLSVFLTRLYLLPAIPQTLWRNEGFVLSKPTALLLLFALIMLLAAVAMIKPKKKLPSHGSGKVNFWLIGIEGMMVGALTGLVGAGGGFLIIPALVAFGGLRMKEAVGTSLLIIAIKSLIGFTGDLTASRDIDWNLLLIFSGLAVVGIFVGSYLSRFIKDKSLKTSFGYFVLVMAGVMIIKEIFF